MARRKVIRGHWSKARIPGTHRDGEDNLIVGRESRWFLRMRGLALRRAGVRTASQKAEDHDYRSYGIPVFDRQTGQGELGEYLSRARQK